MFQVKWRPVPRPEMGLLKGLRGFSTQERAAGICRRILKSYGICAKVSQGMGLLKRVRGGLVRSRSPGKVGKMGAAAALNLDLFSVWKCCGLNLPLRCLGRWLVVQHLWPCQPQREVLPIHPPPAARAQAGHLLEDMERQVLPTEVNHHEDPTRSTGSRALKLPLET